MRILTPLLFFIAAVEVLAQAPVINNIQPVSAGPAQKIVISGSGFSPTLANNTVWFDHVKGTVTTATAYSLEVQVPNQARYSNVEVLVGGLSAKSPMKFSPSYGGVSLDATKFTAATPATAPYTDTNEQFDVASADLDMDGDPDFVTTRGGPTSGAVINDLSVYQNNSTGIGNITLSKISVALTIPGPTANVACGDLNGDGKPDILASRGSSGNNRNEVFVLKNTNTTPGTMAFTNQAKIILDVNQAAFRISIRDLNGDGKPDVIVSNAFNDQDPATDVVIYVYPNQSTLSTISFGTPTKLTVTGATLTYGLEVQDFDGDGRADIVVNQFQLADVFFFRNTSTGNISFAACQKVPTAPGSFIQIVSADLNNDGKPDLIATDTGGGSDYIQFWINASTPGNIAFTVGQTINTDATPWGIDVGDIDGDGDVDIAVACVAGNNINVFRQDGALSFTRVNIPIPGYTARNLRIGDYDGDGKPDIAYTGKPASGFANTLAILRNGNCWNPTITGSSTTICTGQTIPLQTKPAFGVNFDWKLDGVSQTLGSPPYNFSATAAGTYAVTLTGTVDTGCSNTSPNYVLTQDVATFPTDPAIGNNVPCLNSSLNLSTATVAGATYSWAGPNGFTSTSQNPVVTPVALASAGNYTLQLTLPNGCQSNKVTKLLDVASVPKLPITASPSLIGCVGGAVTLSVPSNGAYTYQWNKGGNPMGAQPTPYQLSLPSLSAGDEASYTVSVTSTANTCTQVTDAAALQVYTAPSASFNVSGTQCVSSVITFTDTSTKDARGTLTYSWAFGDGQVSNVQSPTHVYGAANTFSASLSVSYSGACTSPSTPKSIVINAATKPTISTTATSICSGDQTTLSIAGSYNSITWTGVTGSTSSVVITEPGKYKVNTIDVNGCALADSLVIDAKPLISPFVATSKRPVITLGDTTQLSATAGADSYLWRPGKMLSTDSTIANPIAKPQSTTAYIVVAKKAGSCDAKDTVTVQVDVGSALIRPPVLFSPNADTFNDTWLIPETTNYPDWTMTIYDGHGSQVYQQKGYNNANAWDGNYSGKPSPDGTYFYVFSNQKDKPATGSVLLVR